MLHCRLSSVFIYRYYKKKNSFGINLNRWKSPETLRESDKWSSSSIMTTSKPHQSSPFKRVTTKPRHDMPPSTPASYHWHCNKKLDSYSVSCDGAWRLGLPHQEMFNQRLCVLIAATLFEGAPSRQRKPPASNLFTFRLFMYKKKKKDKKRKDDGSRELLRPQTVQLHLLHPIF